MWPLDESTLISMSSSEFGQQLFLFVDRVLWAIEAINFFSTTPAQRVQLAGYVTVYYRPVPWLLWIPGLIFFRALRLAMSLIACVMTVPTVDAATIVSYVQTLRGRLRFARREGLRVKRAENRSRMTYALELFVPTVIYVGTVRLLFSFLHYILFGSGQVQRDIGRDNRNNRVTI